MLLLCSFAMHSVVEISIYISCSFQKPPFVTHACTFISKFHMHIHVSPASLSLSRARALLICRVLTKIDNKVVSKVDNALNEVQSRIESLTDVVEDSARYVDVSRLGFSFLSHATQSSHTFSLLSSVSL